MLALRLIGLEHRGSQGERKSQLVNGAAMVFERGNAPTDASDREQELLKKIGEPTAPVEMALVRRAEVDRSHNSPGVNGLAPSSVA